MVSLECLLLASSIPNFRLFDQSLAGDTFTVISSADNSSGYFLNVSAYFENGSFYRWESFATVAATSNLFASHELFNVADFIEYEEVQASVNGSFTETIAEPHTLVATPSGLKQRAINNCGQFCGKTDHCRGSNKRCRGCRILQWAIGLWQKHCVL